MPFGKQEKYMSRYPSLAAAITKLSSGDTLVIDRASTISSNETIPATVHVRFEKAGLLTISDTYTLTINGSIEAGNFQIFDCSSGSGGVVPTRGVVNVTWFGAVGDGVTDDTAEFQAALDTGLDVFVPYTGNAYQLGDLTMDTNYQRLVGNSKLTQLEYTGSGTFIEITKNHVKIEGFTLTGPDTASTYGIQIGAGLQRNVVDDCIIEKFDVCYSDSGFDNTLHDCTILDYITTGAEALGGANWHCEICRFSATGNGSGTAHMKPGASDNSIHGCIFGNGYRGADMTYDGTNMTMFSSCHFEGLTENEVYAASQNSITMIACRSSGLFRAGQAAPYGPRFTIINMRFRDTPVISDSSQATWVFIGCENIDGSMFTGGPGVRIFLDQYGPLQNVATPEMFAAAGDGTTDDRDAVWNTSKYLDNHGGGYLVLPAGKTYRLASNCIFHDTVTIVPQGGVLKPDVSIYTRARNVEAKQIQWVDCSNCTTPGTDGLQLDWGESRVSWCNDITFAAGALTAGGTLYIDEDVTLGAALSIASDVFPVFVNDVGIDLDDYNLTLNGPIIAPSMDVFTLSGTGVVVFTGGTLLTQDGVFSNEEAVPELILDRRDPSPSDNDIVGKLIGRGRNDAVTPEEIDYGEIRIVAGTKTDGGEDGEIQLWVAKDGVEEKRFAATENRTEQLRDGGPVGMNWYRTDTHGGTSNVAQQYYFGKNSTSAETEYARWLARCEIATANSEAGSFQFKVADGDDSGSVNTVLDITQKGMIASQGGHIDATQTVTSTSNAVAVDCRLGLRVRHDLTENTTVGEPSNPTSGARLVFRFKQHASSSYTVAFNAKFALESTFTMTSTNDAVDRIEFEYDSTDDLWYECHRTQNM